MQFNLWVLPDIFFPYLSTKSPSRTWGPWQLQHFSRTSLGNLDKTRCKLCVQACHTDNVFVWHFGFWWGLKSHRQVRCQLQQITVCTKNKHSIGTHGTYFLCFGSLFVLSGKLSYYEIPNFENFAETLGIHWPNLNSVHILSKLKLKKIFYSNLVHFC